MKAKYIIIAALSFALGLAAGCLLNTNNQSIQPQVSQMEILRDTVFEIREAKRISINAPAKIITKDTVLLLTSAFEARLDTILQTDTIEIIYRFPENLLSLRLAALPDTLARYNLMLLNPKPEPQVNIWLERLSIFAFGLGLGAVAAK